MGSAPKARTAIGFALFGVVATSAFAQIPIQITEFPVGGQPIPLTVGPDGNFWTWNSGTTSVTRMTPTGEVTVFPTALNFPESTPGHCVDAHDGNVWCSNTGGSLVRILASTGESTVFDLGTDVGATDVTFGPDGALWFTDFGLNRIGRMTLSGTVTEFPVPAAFVAPRSITVGPDGALWFTSDAAQVGRMDTAGEGFRFYDLPEHQTNLIAQFSAITKGPDGNLWLGVLENNSSNVVRITPAGHVTEFPLPDPAGSVLDIVAGPDGAIWFTEESANKIGRITTSGTLTEFSLPQPLSGPVGITAGRDRAIWFTELAGRVGRLSGGPLGGVSVPTLGPLALWLCAATLAASGWWIALRAR